MKLIDQTFYRGPNLWSQISGLLLVIEKTEGDDRLLDWRPRPLEAEQAVGFLCDIFPVAVDSADLSKPEKIGHASFPIIELLLATAEVLMRDFCTNPAKGRLVIINCDHLIVYLPCDEPFIGLPAWNLAIEAIDVIPFLINNDIQEDNKRLREKYWGYRQAARRYGLNQTAIVLARAALSRGIPHYRIALPSQFLQLGQGCYRKRINETATDQTSSLATWLSRDKLAVAYLLYSQGLPTPEPVPVASSEEAIEIARKSSHLVVVKPRASGKGKGVTVGISGDNDVVTAFNNATQYKSGVLLEKFIEGDDHRLLVVGGRFVAAARRIPAYVVGDGRQTLHQLIDSLNQDPRRGLPFERVMEWVTIDQEAIQLMAEAGFTLDSIPEEGRKVSLRRAANLSRGGTSVDVTDQIHPDNLALAERVAQLVGLDVTGIDFLTPDIGKSWHEIPCAILEVNSSPGLRPHLAANPDRDVAGPIIEHLFPAGSPSRVPIAAITGSMGKTTTCRMVAAILTEYGMTVALSTTQGSFVGGDTVQMGDLAGGRAACRLLLDPRVQAGVFELARGALIKRGMSLDACDVGAVLNVYDNHVGLDGVRSREDLARVKSLVVQNARKMAVLNADDPLCLAMREQLSSVKLCLVSARPDNSEVLTHLSADGAAAYLDEDGGTQAIKLYEGMRLIGAIPVPEIAAGLGGSYRPAILNALFATAIAFGMGVDFCIIRTALGKFESTYDTNPGRMNFYPNLPFKLLVTWADGVQAMNELARYVESLSVPGKKHIMFCAPGNRPDRYLIDMAKAVSGVFSSFICSDWDDLRGRPACAVANLLAQGLMENGVAKEAVTVASSHDEALKTAMVKPLKDDLLVVVTYSGDKAWRRAQTLAAEIKTPATL